MNVIQKKVSPAMFGQLVHLIVHLCGIFYPSTCPWHGWRTMWTTSCPASQLAHGRCAVRTPPFSTAPRPYYNLLGRCWQFTEIVPDLTQLDPKSLFCCVPKMAGNPADEIEYLFFGLKNFTPNVAYVYPTFCNPEIVLYYIFYSQFFFN